MTGADISFQLLADPTFPLMTAAERRLEAVELMKTAGLGDDPLDAALAVEQAEEWLEQGLVDQAEARLTDIRQATDAGVFQALAGVEPCREKWGEGCIKTVSATGRCMECGAQRVALAVVKTLERAGEIAALPMPDAELERFPSPPGYRVPAQGFIARFKAATGNNDRQIGDLLGMARSSVQAIVGGRVGENLNPSTLEQLDGALQSQIASLERLRVEIVG